MTYIVSGEGGSLNSTHSFAITVVKATGLRGGDSDSFNPYVKVRLLPAADKQQKAKTKVVRRSVNPVFEETFTFGGVDARRLQKRGAAVHMRVFNADAFSKDASVAELVFCLDDVALESQIGVSFVRPLTHSFEKVLTPVYTVKCSRDNFEGNAWERRSSW